MPQYDGTGPRGNGPMSGGIRGYCILKLPDKPGQPAHGYIGKAGEPFFGVICQQESTATGKLPSSQICFIANNLEILRRRILLVKRRYHRGVSTGA